jgi:hypothetical protein
MGRKIEKYYTSLEHWADLYDRISRKMPAPTDSAQEFSEWQKTARAKLKSLLKLDMFESCPMNYGVLESYEFDGYRRDKMIIQTEPDVYMTFYALIPDNIKDGDKRPAIILPPGHGPGKFGTAAATEYEGVKFIFEAMERLGAKSRPSFAQELARKGYLVFAIDSRGDGERREYMDQGMENEKFLTCSHRPVNNAALALGYSILGMMVWDLMRLGDYILGRKDCDGRLACGGMSGGGLQSLYLAAVDERFSLAVTSGWFYGFKESLLQQPHNCACNFVHNLWLYFDCCDIGSLIAPRPFHIESGMKDHLNGSFTGIENVKTQVELTRRSYELMGAEDKLLHFIHPGIHEWCGKKAYEFIDKHLPLA